MAFVILPTWITAATFPFVPATAEESTIANEVFHTVWSLSAEGVVVPLLILLTVTGSATWAWTRRSEGKRDRLLLHAAVASLSMIVAVTLFRGSPGFSPGELFTWSTTGWDRISGDPFTSTEILMNAALFIPAGLLWTLLTGKPLHVLIAIPFLSFLVECLQAVTGTGANDVADLISNSAGGALGVLAGSLAPRLRPRDAEGRPRRSRRRKVWVTASLSLLAAATVTSVFVGAERRSAALEAELTAHFAGTDLETYRAWEAEDLLYEKVFAAASVFTDGARHLDETARVRYPASFFGLRRCVFVDWTPDGVTTTKGAGSECTHLFD
ncbi:hypothetical protein GCM10027160_33910 [Streptomyces calidiresistens]|uniref:VanZ-like domain-containing protein n=1 Tax=Streptomyces calidiresistens TaxID=1485586 RepID=A0A7W3XVI8_9ACTN|nr:VanZ family protein [Streptomyces calidiresistens]MBB0228863.1 hypothetical protein [Streptomyces calidiresistens]